MRAALVAAFAIGCGGSPITGAIEQADTVCGKGPTVKGIDVSDYQGDIDWSKVVVDGVQFAFVRVSDGLTNPDDNFDTYWNGSREAGIVHGAYQFFRPNEDPIKQADMLLAATGPMLADDLPPVIDVEVNSGLSSAQVATAVRAWTAHVKAAIGRDPIVYTGKYFWDDSVGATDLGDLPLWHAQYTSASCPDISSTWDAWAIWQYDDAGTVAGIPAGGVDMDRWNGDRASLDAFLGGGSAAACGPVGARGGIIDDGDPCFAEGGPLAYMREVSGAGDENDLVWTHATDEATEANFADWTIQVAESGTYRVEAYTAAPWAMSKQADYQVTAAGSAMTSVTIDQSSYDGWQSLGEFTFTAGSASGQGVHLGDNTGELPADNVQLVFDAIRLTRLDATSTGSDDPDEQIPGGPEKQATGGCAASGNGSTVFALGALGALVLARRRSRRRRRH
jgi:GH25 family lysozyme M1 (1,4-beta-N-acetylmuramidase)